MDLIFEKLIQEIKEVYGQGQCDYKGREITQEHVLHYLYTSYHRVCEIVDCVCGLGAVKQVLDIGIGYGFYDIILKDHHGLDVSGLELEENIEAYCALPRRHDIEIIAGGLSKAACPIADNRFDVVIFSEVLEHLRLSPLRVFMEIKRMLKPGGYLILTTPNIARLEHIIKMLMGRNIVEPFPDDDRDLDHITDRITHIREYTMRELIPLMQQAKYKQVKRRHSLAGDRRAPGQPGIQKRNIKRMILMPMKAIVPSFRSLLFVVGQKPAHHDN